MEAGLAPEQLEGGWSLRFGLFGCRDSETRGGVAQIGPGLFSGRDMMFAYKG